MKQLKNLSLFKITFTIIINIFFYNPILMILSLIYLLIEFKFKTFLIVFLFIVISLSNSIKTDFVKYGFVDEINSSYIVIDKVLYKTKVYTNSEFEIGQFVKTNDYEVNVDEDNLKHNYRFNSFEDPIIIKSNTLRSLIYKRIDNIDKNVNVYLKNIIYNLYDYQNDIYYLGYGFSFYYLLLDIKRKNKIYVISTLFLYVLLFRFDIKFYLILIDLICENLKVKGINKLSIKIIIICLINKYLLFNNSILLSLLFSYIYLNDFKDKSLIMLIQSLFFNEIQLGISLIYKYYVKFRELLFIFSLFVVVIPILGESYLNIIELSAKLINLMSFSIRGKITYFGIIIYLFIIKILKINNSYVKYLIILFLLIPSINNPIRHINFIDVGQGDATLIMDCFGTNKILIDTGSKYNYHKLKAQLYKEGIYTINYLIISHEDEDHSGNIENLKRDFKIKNIITKGENIYLNNIKLDYLYLGEFDNPNDNSLVYLLSIDNRKVLFTGDISKKVENLIIKKYAIKDLDILKIGHHGSNTSSSSYFIGNVNPTFTTISTNGKYNHPHFETLNTLDSYKLDYIITKEEGCIKFYLTTFLDLCITNKRVEVF